MAASNWKNGKYVPMEMKFCPKAQAMCWANPSKMGVYRCTKCGQEHS